MTGRPAIRAQLEAIPAGTEQLRAVRHMAVDDFDGITDDELAAAARWLYAAAYSATEGARRLESVLQHRTTEKGPTSCTSDPNTTATSTSTAALPTATPPSSAPRSRSNPKTKAAPESS